MSRLAPNELFPDLPHIHRPDSVAAQTADRIRKADRGKGQRFTVILTVAMIVAALAIGATAVTLYQQATRWDPLGQYETQTVIDRLPGMSAPAVRLSGGFVNVTGQKCNNSDEPITVTGTKSWVLIEPPGSIIPDNAPASTDKNGNRISAPERLPGCTLKDYKNPIPGGVRERVIQLAAEGQYETIWVITGIETPEADNGDVGVARSWATTNFTIVYDGPKPVPAGYKG